MANLASVNVTIAADAAAAGALYCGVSAAAAASRRRDESLLSIVYLIPSIKRDRQMQKEKRKEKENISVTGT